MSATPRPWREAPRKVVARETNYVVAGNINQDDAKLIVRAVNNFELLVEALTECYDFTETVRCFFDAPERGTPIGDIAQRTQDSIHDALRAVGVEL